MSRIPVPLNDDRTAVCPVSNGESYRVLVAEPEPLARAGVRAIINATEGARVVSEVSDAGSVVAGASRPDVNAVVLGSTMTGSLHTGELRQMVRNCHDGGRPVILLLGPGDRETLTEGVRAGVRGLVSRLTAAEDLAESLHATARESAFVSSALMLPLLDWVSDLAPRAPASGSMDMSALSAREREVLELLGQGRSNTQIARRLAIKEATVRSHVYHIVTKLGLRTRAEAIVAGLRHCERR
jgi:DNA-binding NarL/FixJ family response regulator